MLGINFDRTYQDFLKYISVKELVLSDAKELGEGAFGVVYRARWTKKPTRFGAANLRKVPGLIALKVVKPTRDGNPVNYAKFFEEVKHL